MTGSDHTTECRLRPSIRFTGVLNVGCFPGPSRAKFARYTAPVCCCGSGGGSGTALPRFSVRVLLPMGGTGISATGTIGGAILLNGMRAGFAGGGL